MGPAIKSIRISTWVSGTNSLLRYEVDHCIIAQAWLSCSTFSFWLYAILRMSQSPLQRTPSSVCQQKNVWNAFTKIFFMLAFLPFLRTCRWSIRCWVWQPRACVSPDPQPGGGRQRPLFKLTTRRACPCVVILLMTIFPLPNLLLLNLLMKGVPAVSRFHHTRHTQPVRHHHHLSFFLLHRPEVDCGIT